MTHATLATAAAMADALARDGFMVLAGSTALLGAGCIAMHIARAPVHRQRLGELTVGVTLLWLALAAVPLPRLLRVGPDAPPRRAETVYGVPSLPSDPNVDIASDPGELPTPSELPAVFAATAPQHRSELDRLAGAVASLSTRDLEWEDGSQSELFDAALAKPAESTRWWTPARLLAAAYMTGVTACAAWLVVGHVLLARLLRGARRPGLGLRAEFETLTREHLPTTPRCAPPRLLVSDHCGRPMACGVLRPVVLLPADAAGTGPADLEPLRQVLRHELAHVYRRDAVGHAILNLALPILYAHPLYWLIRKDVHLSRELIADDWAAAAAPGGRASYAEQLVAYARRTASNCGAHRTSFSSSITARAAVGLIGAFQTQTTFYRRMHMLLHRSPSASLATRCSSFWRVTSWAACAAVLGLSVSLWGASPLAAQTEPAAQPTPENTPATGEAPSPVEPGPPATPLGENTTTAVEPAAAPPPAPTPPPAPAAPADAAAPPALSPETGEALAQPASASANQVAAEPAGRGADNVALSRAERRENGAGRARSDIQIRAAMAYRDLAKVEMARQEAMRKRGATSETEYERAKIELQISELKIELAQQEAESNRFAPAAGAHGSPHGAAAPAQDVLSLPSADRPGVGETSGKGGLPTEDTRPGMESRMGPAGPGRLGALPYLDLVTLATSYSDAAGAVKVAEARLAHAEQNGSDVEKAVEVANVGAARRKESLLRAIAEVSLSGEQQKLQRSQKLFKLGLLPMEEMAADEARVKILSLILGSDDGRTPGGSDTGARGRR